MRYGLTASLALVLALVGCGRREDSGRGEREHSDQYYKDQMDRDTQAAIQGIGADQADKEQMQRTMVDMVRSSQGELAATQLDLCLTAAPRAVVRKLGDSLAMGKTAVIDETDKTPGLGPKNRERCNQILRRQEKINEKVKKTLAE